MRSIWPGYRSCGKHGDNGQGFKKVDINCRECVDPPSVKKASVYVQHLRVFFGLPKVAEPVAAGEQLVML